MRPELSQKVQSVARDFVIFKPVARWNDQYKNFPRFVMEYLVTQYVDPEDPITGQKRIERLLTEHYSDSSERELIRSRIKEQGNYKLIGDLKIRLDAKKDTYWAEVPAIGETTVRVAPSVRSRYEDMLLTVGAWGQLTIEYDSNYQHVVDGKRYPFNVLDFVPFQLTRINLDDYTELRRQFTFDEWLDLMVESIGFASENLGREVKLLMMLRLVPFVESNYNLIELGPRETGKTYTYRNTSARGFVVSGSTTTAASLFFNKTNNKVGILGQKEVVFFDEIAHARFDDAGNTISVLKDYMQTGIFSRLGQQFQSDASIVLGGNIDTDLSEGRPSYRYIHLFEPLPLDLQDPAFLDRLHAYLPGWRMPKISPGSYANGYGFVSDYLAEVFHRLRRHNLGTVVDQIADLDVGSDRNQTAIKKTMSGLLKLLYPSATSEMPDEEGAAALRDLAVESRRLIVEQLAAILPSEYDPSVFKARPRGRDPQ